MRLIECLSSIEDACRMQGQRYARIALLLIIIMSILRGQYAYREMGRFCKLHERELITAFGFKNGKVPAPVSIRYFILSTKFCAVQKAFHKWAKGYVPIEAGERIAIL